MTDMSRPIKGIDDRDVEVTIQIHSTDQCEGGYMFNVWLCAPDEVAEDSEEGGQCTGTFIDAVGMAQDAALQLLKQRARK